MRGGGGTLLVPALSAIVAAGCNGKPPPSQFPNAADLIGRMKATYACANGVQVEGRIDHFSPRGRVRADVHVFAVNPARVRIDVEAPALDAIVITLTSDGKTFRMADQQNKEFLTGPATPCNLARMTQVPVPGHALVSLLRGEAPLLVHEPAQASIAWEADHYRLDIQSKHQATQALHFQVYDDDWNKPWSEQRLRLTSFETAQAGQVLYNAKLSDHAMAHTAPPRKDEDGLRPDVPPSGGPCDVEVPRTIQMTVPHAENDVEFSYDDVKLNPPLLIGAFNQPVPEGMRTVPVDCKDR